MIPYLKNVQFHMDVTIIIVLLYWLSYFTILILILPSRNAIFQPQSYHRVIIKSMGFDIRIKSLVSVYIIMSF